jgi:glycosyltransferase involved in cell wall biosynthesis
MRICLVSPEVFYWGYHGGFGFLTRSLGGEFARRGHRVCVVTVRRGEQGEVEELDGMTVYGFPAHEGKPPVLSAALSRFGSMEYYREADADIYHSEAISYNTLAAQKAMPDRCHAITFQDPYDLLEWRKISRVDPRYRLTPQFKSRLIIENRFLSRACREADALYAQAKYLIPKARKLFRLERDPSFLPNPVVVPRRRMRKAADPTVCFLARWDPQKRVELFFGLAERFPDVEFVAMGRSHDPAADAFLRKRYGNVHNLTLTGFVSEKEKSCILERPFPSRFWRPWLTRLPSSVRRTRMVLRARMVIESPVTTMLGGWSPFSMTRDGERGGAGAGSTLGGSTRSAGSSTCTWRPTGGSWRAVVDLPGGQG